MRFGKWKWCGSSLKVSIIRCGDNTDTQVIRDFSFSSFSSSPCPASTQVLILLTAVASGCSSSLLASFSRLCPYSPDHWLKTRRGSSFLRTFLQLTFHSLTSDSTFRPFLAQCFLQRLTDIGIGYPTGYQTFISGTKQFVFSWNKLFCCALSYSLMFMGKIFSWANGSIDVIGLRSETQ